MAGNNHNEDGQKEITNNGTDPVTETQNEDEVIIEEYVMLDSKLDELNTALDYLEEKNDNIIEQLKELLQSNIEIRQEMQNENINSPPKNVEN